MDEGEGAIVAFPLFFVGDDVYHFTFFCIQEADAVRIAKSGMVTRWRKVRG
jgi:hypothetical protein